MSEDAPTLFDFYSFDISAIINGRKDIFIPTTFGPVWEAIEGMVAAGQVRAVDEVKRELSKKSDEALAWAKRCSGLFVALSREVQLATEKSSLSTPDCSASAADPAMELTRS